MKSFATVIALAAAVQGFAPIQPEGRPATDLKKSIFDTVSDMDLFNTNGVGSGLNRNAYGARNQKMYKKNLKVGRITGKSYVPSGMTQEQYANLRTKEASYRDASYKKNADKEQVFKPFYDFYKKRGTDDVDNWRSVTNGHDMAKTKYDWDNVKSLMTTATVKDNAAGKKQVKKFTPAAKKRASTKVSASGKKVGQKTKFTLFEKKSQLLSKNKGW